MTVTGRFDLARDESDKTASYCTDSAGNAIYGPNEDHYTAHLNFTLQFKKMHLSLRTNDLQTARANGNSSTTWTARAQAAVRHADRRLQRRCPGRDVSAAAARSSTRATSRA